MRISDWSSDVCSSDLFGFRRRLWRGRQCRAEIPILARAGGRAAAEEEIFIGADGDPVIERKGGARGRRATHRLDDEDAILQRDGAGAARVEHGDARSEEHTSELQSLMRHSYAVF